MKRYAFKVEKPWGEGSLELHNFGEDPDGDWVRYDDAQTIIVDAIAAAYQDGHRAAQAAIAEAVKAEREACMRIATRRGASWNGESCGAAYAIADAIRARSKP